MTVHEHQPTPPGSSNGDDLSTQLEALGKQYGNRFLREAAPDHRLPAHGMTATDALRLIRSCISVRSAVVS